MRASRAIAMSLTLGLFAPGWSLALDTVVIGEDGDLDWEGEGQAVVTTIDAEHRSPLDPNNLLVGNAPRDLVEFAHEDFPRSILPLRMAEGDNVAVGTIDRGGDIRSPNVFDFSGTFKPLALKMMLMELLTDEPGGELLAFARKNQNALGILVLLDLGARFGVERIRIYPRNTIVASPSTPFQNDYLRSYELFTNDGLNLTSENTPIWEPLIADNDNQFAVIDVPIDPPRYVQHMRLRATSPIDFEIDEIEIFGKGFLSKAEYVSDIFDAGQPAVWGTLRWVEDVLGDPRFSSLRIRTRTGTDALPFVYTRRLRGKQDAEDIPSSLENPGEEMTLAEYRTFPQEEGQTPVADAQGREWMAGAVTDDLINWSPFSTPFPADAANGPGLPIVSPSPRRYMQFQIIFSSDDLEAARVLKSLSFDLLTPPFAAELVGEVFPREVEVSKDIPFTFAVRAAMGAPGLRGFDTIEIATPSRISSIDEVEIIDGDGGVVATHQFASLDEAEGAGGFAIIAVADDRFAVRFPIIEVDGTQVRIRFQTNVLIYSTNFTASAQLSTDPGAAQTVDPGNATFLGEGDEDAFSGTTVLSPGVLKGQLLGQMAVGPNPFTPNGDGINDEATIQYNLLSLSTPRPIEIALYDLSGRRVRVLFDGLEANGRYLDKAWDGRDDQGQVVPPGLYIARISVAGDSGQAEQSQVVGVAY
ncbi:MAG: gliding motility-associated C-terminal domain-containing protein [Candidatus Latescibacterota bacterium]|nr:gliding motility-associated C-terminal domain-containing protein [Candidatus Latescibacterota bacterium]